jgi:hypothetical protein
MLNDALGSASERMGRVTMTQCKMMLKGFKALQASPPSAPGTECDVLYQNNRRDMKSLGETLDTYTARIRGLHKYVDYLT